MAIVAALPIIVPVWALGFALFPTSFLLTWSPWGSEVNSVPLADLQSEFVFRRRLLMVFWGIWALVSFVITGVFLFIPSIPTILAWPVFVLVVLVVNFAAYVGCSRFWRSEKERLEKQEG